MYVCMYIYIHREREREREREGARARAHASERARGRDVFSRMRCGFKSEMLNLKVKTLHFEYVASKFRTPALTRFCV